MHSYVRKLKGVCVEGEGGGGRGVGVGGEVFSQPKTKDGGQKISNKETEEHRYVCFNLRLNTQGQPCHTLKESF